MTAGTRVSRLKADLALAGIALIWGSTFVVVKEALAGISTVLFLTLRLGLAAVALAIAFRLRPGGLRPFRESIGGGALAGVFLFGGFLLQTMGLRYTTPSKSAFLTGLSIVMVPLLGSAVYRSVPSFSEWAGVTVAAAGMALLTLPGESLRMGFGDLLTLGCAVAFAIHIIMVGHISRKIGFESLSMLQVTTAALIGLGTFWWVEPAHVRWTPGLLAAVGITGLLATALAFTVQAWAQRHTSATRTALIFALEPVFAWLTSYLLTGEVLSGRATLGATLILGGIVLVELKPIDVNRHRF